jgi:hypothetical protein
MARPPFDPTAAPNLQNALGRTGRANPMRLKILMILLAFGLLNHASAETCSRDAQFGGIVASTKFSLGKGCKVSFAQFYSYVGGVCPLAMADLDSSGILIKASTAESCEKLTGQPLDGKAVIAADDTIPVLEFD